MNAQTTQEKKVMLVGLPNTGKSHLFNNLTGRYSVVSNYPFTTLELHRGSCRVGGYSYEIIDTPGFYSFHVHSEQEFSLRNILLEEEPDLFIQCIDANRLKQSLRLTSDLIELDIPFVICLNIVDETTRKGIWIDSERLSKLLGVPVIETVAVEHLGMDKLKQALSQARKGKGGVPYSREIEEKIEAIQSKLPSKSRFSRKFAQLLLAHDPYWPRMLAKELGVDGAKTLAAQAENIRHGVNGRLSWMMNRQCAEWVESIAEQTVKKQKLALGKFSETFAGLCRHPVGGVFILLLVIMLIYFSVVNVANVIAGFLDQSVWVPVSAFLSGLLGQGFWNDFLIGEYGLLSLGFANALLTVVPILSVFYLLYSTLEDVGYLPNLCVLTKRLFDRVGLCGGAIMPLVLGFGCKTMATLSTKTLRTQRERNMTIFLIAFAIPCAAQMALNMSILGKKGLLAFGIAYGVLFGAEILAALALNAIMKKEKETDFIQELPLIRLPNLRAVLVKTGYRLLNFLEEALPVFLMTAVILFFADRIGLLNIIKHALSPIITGILGLPIQMVDVLLVCIARREAAAGLLIKLVDEGHLSYVQCIVSVVLTTTFIPCLANVVAMGKEIGVRVTTFMVLLINAASVVMSGALNWVLKLFM